MTRQPYIGRLAPSPTGLLHLGHAATFWQAFQRAREQNGTLLFRNDDLDPHRSRPEFATAMLEDLHWLGIAWQNPVINQSERFPLYLEAFETLAAAGHIYACTCSRKDLARLAQAPHEEEDAEPIYDNHCRPNLLTTTKPLPNTAYRFRVPDAEAIAFTDRNLGPQRFVAGEDFGDFVLWSRDGIPSYQLATVVDDTAMRITEVVRGRDLLKSTARQILLQRALNLPTPAYFHTQLLTDEHGVRLSKRHDALAIRTLREKGLSPAEVLHMTSVTSDS
ncbi:MAG: tRNA glutamyl-Q(34) synthetase GluQRS [Edaphobacter sp.]